MPTEPDWTEISALAERMAQWLSRSHDPDLISELVSIAVAHVYKKYCTRYKKRNDTAFSTWAYKVMKRKIVKVLKEWANERKNTISFDSSPASESWVTVEPVILFEELDELEYLWKPLWCSLTSLERKIVSEKWQNPDLTDDEIARRVGAQSGASIRVHMSHIRAKTKSFKNKNFNKSG